MDDISAFLKDAGTPPALIGLGAAGLYIGDKLGLWKRPARKSREEILAQRESDFMDHFETRLKCVESEMADCRRDRDECQDNIAQALRWIMGLTEDLRKTNLLDLRPIPRPLLDLTRKIGIALGEAE